MLLFLLPSALPKRFSYRNANSVIMNKTCFLSDKSSKEGLKGNTVSRKTAKIYPSDIKIDKF